MELSLNQAIKIKEGTYSGIYRVVASTQQECFLAVIESEFEGISKRGPRPKIASTPTPKAIASSQLIILPNITITHLLMDYCLDKVELKLSNRAIKSITKPLQFPENRKSIYTRHQENICLMQDFLDPSTLTQSVIRDRSFSGLVKKSSINSQSSNRKIYRLLTRLIIYGFSQNSLIPHYFLSGAPGVERPYEVGSNKSGAKTFAYHHAKLNGLKLPLDTPGMSAEWKSKCEMSIDKLRKPHPSLKKMYFQVLDEQFSTDLQVIKNGRIIPLSIAKGSAPTFEQFKYFVNKYYDKLGHIKRKTTSSNYNQNHRGILGKSYEGISGPGHTYAIDSSLGDVFLVSSLNRAIVIGRPVIYMIVDVWSGAVVGFYVCLSGPKWEMAKVAVFSASYDPEKMADLMGIPYMEVFRHKPRLCLVLLCDRGEYISHNASLTCLKLEIDQEFTAPYRGDGKGIVEVQFRITKDDQIDIVPGTHDAKRIEREMFKSKPEHATLTLQEYMIHLSSQIRKYNLNADMSHRLDDYMKAAGVEATPSMLWDWGHDIGIGFKRNISDEELITTLLPKPDAKSTKHGLKVNKRLYANQDNPLDQKLAALARNYGESEIDAWIYPGNIQSIWTNEGCESGLRTVSRSHCDSSFVSEEEYMDADIRARLNKLDSEFKRTELAVQEHKIQKANVAESLRRKKDDKHLKPTGKQVISENRKVENDFMMHQDLIDENLSDLSHKESSPLSSDQFNSWIEELLMGDKK